eukprot:513450-Lingulodinium_polyedra.AAC.1
MQFMLARDSGKWLVSQADVVLGQRSLEYICSKELDKFEHQVRTADLTVADAGAQLRSVRGGWA